MLCDKCLNRTICKYYAFFADAPMIIEIESCEKANFGNKKPITNEESPTFRFKQPIDYALLNAKQEETEEYNETEEKITVDLADCNEPEHVTIMDLLIGDDDNDNGQKES